MASRHWPIDEAPGRDVRAVIPEDLRLESGERLAAGAPNLRRLIEAPSIFGHDAFLKERELVGRALHDALSPLYATQHREIAA